METEERYEPETWLKYMMDELNIEIKELASAIGRSEKQVKRYQTDGFPSNKNGKILKQRCFEYIYKKSCCETYHHIENRIFFNIFINYFNALNSQSETKVTQKDIADFLGVEQKTISKWMNPDKKAKYTKFSTERQYQILNFFFSHSMKHIGKKMFSLEMPYYLENFDYLGYCAINQKMEYYLKNAIIFFYLMQNGTVLSEVDTFMFDYIDVPLPLYLMLARQFEAALRYAKVLPSSQETIPFVSCYQTFDMEFDEFLSQIAVALRNNGKPSNHYYDKYTKSVLHKQLKLLSQCVFFGTKQQQQDEREQIEKALLKMKVTPEGNKEKYYQLFFKQIMNIVTNVKFWEERHQKKEVFSSEQILEKIENSYGRNTILMHIPVFLDTINFDNQYIRSFRCTSFQKTILYPFLRKMVHTSEKETIIREMESEIFKHGMNIDYNEDGEIIFANGVNIIYDEDGKIISQEKSDKNYKKIKKNYRNLHNTLQAYLTMSKFKNPKKRNQYALMPEIGDCDKKYLAYEEHEAKIQKNSAFFLKNAEKLFTIFPETDLLELIQYKIDFSPEDWHLWGLVQVGMMLNPAMTIQKMLDFMETPDEIFKFSSEKCLI